MDYKVKRLEMIQNIIVRYDGYVFQARLGAPLLLGAIWGLALTHKPESLCTVLAATMAIALIFWGIGSYYQRQSDIFRAMYQTALAAQTVDSSKMELTPSDKEKEMAPTLLRVAISLPQLLLFLILCAANACMCWSVL